MKKLWAALFLSLSLGCIWPTPKPPQQPTPTPTPAATATPAPSPTPEVMPFISSVYLGSCCRWEAMCGGWLHRKSRGWTNVLRFSGWDCEAPDDNSTTTMVANSRRWLTAIRAEGDTRKLIAVLNYWPGRPSCPPRSLGFGAGEAPTIQPALWDESGEFGRRLTRLPRLKRINGFAMEGGEQMLVEDCELGQQLDFWREHDADILLIETVDEFGGTLAEAQTIRAYIYSETDKRGMKRHPLYAAATAQQVLEANAWQAWDVIGLEHYRSYPFAPWAESGAPLAESMRAQLAAVTAVGKKAIVVGEAYSRNYDADPATVPEVVRRGSLWAQANRDNGVIGWMPFSWCRRSGAWEYPDVQAQLARAGTLLLTGTDPGPDVPPPPTPEPPPPPNPGGFEPARTSFAFDSGSTKATVGILRTGGTLGPATVDYRTEDSTGVAGTDYVATSGTLTFEDGQEGASFDVALLPATTGPGTLELNVRLSNPTGGTIIRGSGFCRVVVWGNSARVVGFIAPTIKQQRGNTIRVSLRRDGDLFCATRLKLRTVPGTAEPGIEYDHTEGWVEFATGQRDAFAMLPLLSSARPPYPRRLTVEIYRIDSGPYTVSPRTGTATVEIY